MTRQVLSTRQSSDMWCDTVNSTQNQQQGAEEEMCRVTHHEITQPVLPDKAHLGNAKQCSLGRCNQSFRAMDETHQKQDTCDSYNDKTMTFKTVPPCELM